MIPKTTLREYKVDKTELLERLGITNEAEMVTDVVLISGVLTIKTKEEAKEESEPVMLPTPSPSDNGELGLKLL